MQDSNLKTRPWAWFPSPHIAPISLPPPCPNQTTHERNQHLWQVSDLFKHVPDLSAKPAKQGLLLSAMAEEALFHLHHRQDLYPLWHSHSAPHTGWCQMVWQPLMWVGRWLVIWRWQMLYCAPVPDITLLPRLQPLFSCHHCVHYRCQSNY